MTRQSSIQLPPATLAQIADLAAWWGEPAERNRSTVIKRAIDIVWRIETARREAMPPEVVKQIEEVLYRQLWRC